MNPTGGPYAGPFGTAVRCGLPDRPDAAETVCHWLITAPTYHPAWFQYYLVVVRLRDGIPGFPPPIRKVTDATHELLVVALDARYPRTPESMAAGERLRFLQPVNHAHQFEATDREMEQLADLAAQAVVHGVLNPETGDAPDRIRAEWLSSLVKTLAHVRGEEHSR